MIITNEMLNSQTGKTIDFSNQNIEMFDEVYELIVDKDLDLSNSTIERMPHKLTVNGDLYLDGATVTKMPRYLQVNGNLFMHKANLSDSAVFELIVTGAVEANEAIGLYVSEKIHVGHYFNFRNGVTGFLPQYFYVADDCNFNDSNLDNLMFSFGACVRGNLDISGTNITILPKDVKVGGNLICIGTGLNYISRLNNIGGNIIKL